MGSGARWLPIQREQAAGEQGRGGDRRAFGGGESTHVQPRAMGRSHLGGSWRRAGCGRRVRALRGAAPWAPGQALPCGTFLAGLTEGAASSSPEEGTDARGARGDEDGRGQRGVRGAIEQNGAAALQLPGGAISLH